MPRAAVFDVDGTLADTNYLHVTAWWQAFQQAGHRVAMRDVHRAIGLGSADLVERLLGEGRDPDAAEGLSAAHKALYGTFFDRLAPFDQAADLLRALAAREWRVVLATSAQGPELAALRRAIGADDVIHAAAGSDDVEHGKPAPDVITRARQLAGAPPELTVFVGDSVWDMRAAAAAGVTAVGLLSGGIPRADLEEAGAGEVHRDPAHLLARLNTSAFADTP